MLGLAGGAYRKVARPDRLVACHRGELEVAPEHAVAGPDGHRRLVHRGLDDPDQRLARRRLQPVPQHLQLKTGRRAHPGHRVGVAAGDVDGGGQHRLRCRRCRRRAHRHRVLAGRHPLVCRDRAVTDVPEHDPGRRVAERVKVDVDRRGVGGQVRQPQPAQAMRRAGGPAPRWRPGARSRAGRARARAPPPAWPVFRFFPNESCQFRFCPRSPSGGGAGKLIRRMPAAPAPIPWVLAESS